MFKRTIETFAGSKSLDGTPLFPGRWVITWVRIGGVWVGLGMEPYD